VAPKNPVALACFEKWSLQDAVDPENELAVRQLARRYEAVRGDPADWWLTFDRKRRFIRPLATSEVGNHVPGGVTPTQCGEIGSFGSVQ
jgi:hypothetical protein